MMLIAVVVLAGCTPGTATVTPSPSPTVVAPGGTFGELTFSDEFDGPEVDTTKWFVADGHRDVLPGQPWWRNFKKENVYIEDGALVIRTAKDEVGYSSGSVNTGDPSINTSDPGQSSPFEQAFGRFEARLKFPTQQGHGCAFWLWNESQMNVDGSGRDGAEIDIIEKYWLIDRAIHALNWDGYGAEKDGDLEGVDGEGLDNGDWHIIRLDWYPDEYVFFVDNKETWRTSAGGVLQAPNYVILSDEILNFGVGPEEMGVGPIEDAVLPDYFYVDYVRVYEYVPPDEA
jgi:beta-glucanase (GH16 family)